MSFGTIFPNYRWNALAHCFEFESQSL